MTTTRDYFHAIMAERRAFAPGSLDHAYRSRAARIYVWMMRGLAPGEYPQ